MCTTHPTDTSGPRRPVTTVGATFQDGGVCLMCCAVDRCGVYYVRGPSDPHHFYRSDSAPRLLAAHEDTPTGQRTRLKSLRQTQRRSRRAGRPRRGGRRRGEATRSVQRRPKRGRQARRPPQPPARRVAARPCLEAAGANVARTPCKNHRTTPTSKCGRPLHQPAWPTQRWRRRS